MAAMHATFYGGPADGGELVLAEPIRTWLRFPMSVLEAAELLELERPATHLVPNSVPAAYRLDMLTPDLPFRDAAGRVRYLYVLPTTPHPKEENPHHDDLPD